MEEEILLHQGETVNTYHTSPSSSTMITSTKERKILWLDCCLYGGLSSILWIILVGLAFMAINIFLYSLNIQGTIVSPFDNTVEHYAPTSTKPCSYPTLLGKYPDTVLCNCMYLFYLQVIIC